MFKLEIWFASREMFLSSLRLMHFTHELLIGMFALHSLFHPDITNNSCASCKTRPKVFGPILLIPKTGQSDSNGTTQHTLVLAGNSENSCFPVLFSENGKEYNACGAE